MPTSTAQGGAYATGVLVLISSGAVAVAIMKWQQRHHVLRYGVDCGDLPLHDVREHGRAAGRAEDCVDLHRDDHLHVAGVARAAIDRASRTRRRAGRGRSSFHRRPPRDSAPIRIIANRPDKGDRAEYEHKLSEARDSHHLAPNEPVLFLEVGPATRRSSAKCFTSKAPRSKASGFCGARARRFRTRSRPCCSTCATRPASFRTRTSAGPKAIPIAYLLKFLVFGEGDTAPVTREVLRQTEDDPQLQAADSCRIDRSTRLLRTPALRSRHGQARAWTGGAAIASA